MSDWVCTQRSRAPINTRRDGRPRPPSGARPRSFPASCPCSVRTGTSGSKYFLYVRDSGGGAPPIGPAGGRDKNYFLSAFAGTLTDAESFVISSNLFCASAISEGCVVTRR